MNSLVILFICKLLSLIGAVLNTVGFLTFFFWESLESYRWEMIAGGLILIVISELVAYLLAKKMANTPELEEDD
ncbi:hypothetical protein [uncultured Pseudoteredinibacter sp.]|uniref:hypothetical protein n=1 Tax=uncultured Pseudoteredinibacter sp. TaxID=1641701 RepID=UPI00260A494E|nr:hypothetical protein [uncultured Pseudoteredinibacter sp.]